ncbi:thioredoxin-like protein [Calycina marina]|uniref:Thioredoxin-like protein n=1 Tax=Calycina marina TaxID=1763456 RepID=A0A9P7ZCB0_9HELO|nr:thioredoxin-like protein [Calycina marina]
MFRTTLPKMTKFNIEIVSDTVCPWCYVGKQKLEQAITQYKQDHPKSNDEFSTTWMPFYLNPDAPKVGADKVAMYRAKLGPRTDMIFGRLLQVGADCGINFKFGGKTGNTRDSHRLIQLGKSKSPAMQTRVVEEFFASYFENEGDITDHQVLTTAAVKAGLSEDEVTKWLKSDLGGPEVDREVEEAKMQQISGVPNFTIQGKYEVGGAQDPGVFYRLFEKIKAAEASNV